MGTTNFWRRNTSMLYDTDGDFCEFDIISDLQKTSKINDRNFQDCALPAASCRGANTIALYSDTIWCYGASLKIELLIVSIPGYYDGVAYDYEIRIYHEYYSEYFTNIDTALTDLLWSGYNGIWSLIGLVKYHRGSIEKKLENRLNAMGNEIESVFSKHTGRAA